MRPSLRGIVALLLGALVLAGCREVPPRGGAVKVVATITPLADWAREVGGERVRVQLIVPTGMSPRTYEPTPRQRGAIQTADVVLFNGLGLEPWIDEILEESPNSRIVVLEISQFTGPLTERIPRRARKAPDAPDLGGGTGGRRDEEQFATAPVYSPYLWLDPRSAMIQVNLVAQSLTRADPDGVVTYRQNAARYNGELENLDGSIFREVERWRWRSLLSTNRFLYPFARRYGLALSLFGDLTRTGPVPAGQPLLVDRLVLSPAATRDLDSRRPVVALNPLAGQTYVELMRTNVHSMTMVMAGR